MAARSLSELIAPDWAEALEPVAAAITGMGDFLRAEIAAGRSYLPAGENILRAFRQPMADVRVLIVGQDPYPTPGHPVGLSFSVAPEVSRLPPAWQTSSASTPRTSVIRSRRRATSRRGASAV